MYGMRSTSFAHQFLKRKLVVRTQNEVLHEKYALAHVYITVCC